MHVYETPRKRAQLILQARRVRDWRGIEISRAVFIAATAVFYAAGIALKLGAKFTVESTLILLIVNSLAGLSFLYFYWSIPALVNRYKDSLKFFITPIAVGVVTLSKIISDASIAELSGLSPQDLPGAQLLLTFILTPVIWLLGLSLTFAYFSIPLMILLVIHALVQNFKQHRTIESKLKRSTTPQITLIAAVFLSSILPLTVMEKVASKAFYEPRLRQAIAFASFHLPATYCGLPAEKGVEVAPMPDDQAGLAIPDEKQGYLFEVIGCKRKSKTPEEATVIVKSLNTRKPSA